VKHGLPSILLWIYDPKSDLGLAYSDMDRVNTLPYAEHRVSIE